MDYSIKVNIEADSSKVFIAILNHLNDWWGVSVGNLNKIGDEFTTTFGKSYWKFRIIDFKENTKIIWKCIDGEPEFNREWIGSEINWTILNNDKYSTVQMEHIGLTPKLDCYNVCSATWDKFIGESLKSFVETGKGDPHFH